MGSDMPCSCVCLAVERGRDNSSKERERERDYQTDRQRVDCYKLKKEDRERKNGTKKESFFKRTTQREREGEEDESERKNSVLRSQQMKTGQGETMKEWKFFCLVFLILFLRTSKTQRESIAKFTKGK